MRVLNLSGLQFATALTSADDNTIHMHEFYECFYISEGSIIHEVDGKNIILSTGDAVIIAPYFIHNFRRIPGQTCTHRDILISPEKFEECCNLIDPDLKNAVNTAHYIQYKFSKSDMENFEKNIIAYISSQDIPKKQKFETCLIVSALSHTIISESDDESPTNNDFKSKCIVLLNSTYTHYNAVAEIYEKLGYNHSYVSSKFTEIFGTTLTNKVNTLKVEYSAYLLSITDYTIPQICDKIGISSIPYFHKLFKNRYGVTPSRKRSK